MDTALTRLVGVRHPIVQTGMGWVAAAKLVSAVANAGGLGIIAAGTLDFGQLARAITETKSRTARPFGVNLRSDAPDVFERAELMIKEGVLKKDPKPEVIFGQHVLSLWAAGEVGVRAGAMLASTDDLDITVTGKGSHGATLIQPSSARRTAGGSVEEVVASSTAWFPRRK